MREKDRYVNILIVGYGGRKAKSLKLNVTFLKRTLVLSGILFAGVLTFSLLSFYENLSLKREVAQLKSEREKLKVLLAKEQERNSYLQEFKDKVKLLEGKLVTIDKFLREKGIRRVPSGVGGAKTKLDILDIEYVSFLHEEADKFQKYLSRVPLGPPVWGKITSRYGYRTDPFTGNYEFHEGVDIRAPWGTRVRATADGKVIYAGWKGGYGKIVILQHAYGFRTMYAHLSKISVKPGQWVRSGDVVGYVGSTGRSTGPHVHYEVWRYSKRENPIKYMYVRW